MNNVKIDEVIPRDVTKDLAMEKVSLDIGSMIYSIVVEDDENDLVNPDNHVWEHNCWTPLGESFPEMVEAYTDALNRKWQKELDAKLADRLEQLQKGEL